MSRTNNVDIEYSMFTGPFPRPHSPLPDLQDDIEARMDADELFATRLESLLIASEYVVDF